MNIGRQGKMVTRTGTHDEKVKAGAESFAKPEDVIDATPAASRAVQPKDEFAFQLLKVRERVLLLSRTLIPMNRKTWMT